MKIRLFYNILFILISSAFIIIPTGCAKKEQPKEVIQTGEEAEAAGKPVEEMIFTRAEPGPWAGKEEGHVPQIAYTMTETGITVTVSVNHEMDAEQPHYIMWIKLTDGEDNLLGENSFQPDDKKPQAVFELTTIPSKLTALEKCNLHGIWREKVEIKQD